MSPQTSRRRLRIALLCLAALCMVVMQGCGGGSSSGSASSDTSLATCAPAQTSSTSVDLSGVTVTQLNDDKNWVASLMTQSYLWPDDIPVVNAQDSAYSNASAPYGALKAYFQALLSPQVTSSGRKKDRYSYVSTARATDAYYQGDSVTGLGLEWVKVADPGVFRLRHIEPDSAAARTSGLQRGDTLVKVMGVTWAEAGATPQARQLWNGGINPSTTCRTTLEVLRNGESLTLAVDSAPYIPQSVPLTKILTDQNKQAVGYVHFTDHTAPAEAALIAAINRFKEAQVSDVVVDMRYNGGGYLYVANALASMLSKPEMTDNKVFYSAQYGPNSRRSKDNKNFAAQACIMAPDYTCTRSSDALPHLGLARVYVLTTGATCSASEAVINGLRGVEVQVITLGQTTCGKPYGFQSRTHNGIAYFPIQMQFSNAQGFGDYADGMAPTCVLEDDLTHVLGDPRETLLAGALTHRSTGACPSVGSSAASVMAGAPANVFAAQSLRMLPLTLVSEEDDSLTPGRRPLIREGANATEPQR